MLKEQLIKEFENIVGKDYIICQKESLAQYTRGTYGDDVPVSLVVMPENTAQVQELVHIAGRYRQPLYPISCGQNTAFGSKTPVIENSVILDLTRMNRILDFDVELGSVTVEPGVSFLQLFLFLQEQKMPFIGSVTGASPHASLIGNILERGHGTNLYTDRAEFCCSMEIVLGNGEIIKTGQAGFKHSHASKASRYGFGPDIQDLFVQSNLGIITSMTIFLMAKPHYFCTVGYQIKDTSSTPAFVAGVRNALSHGLCRHSGFGMMNHNRFLIAQAMQTVDWPSGNHKIKIPQHTFSEPPNPRRWHAAACIYTATKKQAKEEIAILKRYLGSCAKSTLISQFDHDEIDLILDNEYNKLKQIKLACTLPYSPGDAIQLGAPSSVSLKTCYWLLTSLKNPEINPEMDGCGIYALTCKIALKAECFLKASEIATRTIEDHGFIPLLSLTKIVERTGDLICFIIFDRHKASEEERAARCYQDLILKLVDSGFYPTRLAHTFHEAYLSTIEQQDIIRQIKKTTDPHGIISPNKYII